MRFTGLNIPLDCLSGLIVPKPNAGHLPPIENLTADSRLVQPGDYFICLRGERIDAHTFARDVSARGGYLIHSEPALDDLPGVRVSDTYTALATMATAWRLIVNPVVIGITGSNGKTSCKELSVQLATAWLGEDKVIGTLKNDNNHFGVPFTLLRLRPETRLAVVEMGTNHPGEVPHLSRIGLPDIAIMTSLSYSHAGHFGSLEAIAIEKAGITAGMKGRKNSALILHSETEYADLFIRAAAETDSELLSVPADDPEVVPTGNSQVLINNVACAFAFTGTAQIQNLKLVWRALKYSAVLLKIDFDDARCAAALGHLKQAAGRLQLIPVPDYPDLDVWDDSYNANEESYVAALDALKKEAHPVFGAFGKMGELGEFSEPAHRAVGKAASWLRAVCFHSDIQAERDAFSDGLEEGGFRGELYMAGQSDAEVVAGFAFLSRHFTGKASLLIKGSRSTKMERYLEMLRNQGKLKL